MAIVWDKIGSFEFLYLRGGISPRRAVAVEITRPAVNGRAFRKDSIKGKVFQLRSLTDALTMASGQTLIETTYPAQVLTVAASITQTGKVYTGPWLCLDWDLEREPQVVESPVGGPNGGAALIWSIWTFVYKG